MNPSWITLRPLVSRAVFVSTLCCGALASAQRELPCGTTLSQSDAEEVRFLALSGANAPLQGPAADLDYVVPVAFHVVRRSDGTGGLSAANLDASFADLQVAFAGTGIQFCRPVDTNFIDDDGFFQCVCGPGVDVLRETDVVYGALNVYFAPKIVSQSLNLCGISSFSYSGTQGIVMRNSCTAQGDNPSTLAHEVGHYFDLMHTHETIVGVECVDGSNCENAGDQICDTPADPGLGSHNVSPVCDYTGPNVGACSWDTERYDPDTANFMSYSRKGCRTHFSPQQIERMRTALVERRPELAHTSCPDFDSQPIPGMGLVSATPSGESGSAGSSQPSLSRDGRFVAFRSEAADLLPGAAPAVTSQIYVRDLEAGTLERVSVGVNDEPADGACDFPSVSADGRYVAFTTSATNLSAADVDDSQDVYRFDRSTGAVVLVSVAQGGAGSNGALVARTSISDDGRFIAFASDATNLVPEVSGSPLRQVYVVDCQTGQVELVSRNDAGTPGVSHSQWPSISGDGRFVAFSSDANNLDPADGNAPRDIFVRDRRNGTTRLVSADANGAQGFGFGRAPAISADGSRVAFQLAANGSWPGDETNFAKGDIALKDLSTGELILVSVSPTDSQALGDSTAPAISADGARVAFVSDAPNLLDPEQLILTPQVYLRDLDAGTTVLVTAVLGTMMGGGPSESVALDATGARVALASAADDLVSLDDNGSSDVFALELATACDLPVESFCAGDVAGPCPCGNPGGPDSGCAGSSGGGARLAAGGSTCVAQDDLVLSVTGAGAGGGLGLLLQGLEAPAQPLQDGLSCLAGSLVVVEVLELDAVGAGQSHVRLAAAGGVAPGFTRAYQLWYRDRLGPCGQGGNLSQALRVRWR